LTKWNVGGGGNGRQHITVSPTDVVFVVDVHDVTEIEVGSGMTGEVDEVVFGSAVVRIRWNGTSYAETESSSGKWHRIREACGEVVEDSSDWLLEHVT
jgi:hypothetical protein